MSACRNAHRFGTCDAEQTATRACSRPVSTSHALHMRARGMACYMHIGNNMTKAARMRKSPRAATTTVRGLQLRFPENRHNRRFGKTTRSPPGACDASCI